MSTQVNVRRLRLTWVPNHEIYVLFILIEMQNYITQPRTVYVIIQDHRYAKLAVQAKILLHHQQCMHAVSIILRIKLTEPKQILVWVMQICERNHQPNYKQVNVSEL